MFWRRCSLSWTDSPPSPLRWGHPRWTPPLDHRRKSPVRRKEQSRWILTAKAKRYLQNPGLQSITIHFSLLKQPIIAFLRCYITAPLVKEDNEVEHMHKLTYSLCLCCTHAPTNRKHLSLRRKHPDKLTPSHTAGEEWLIGVWRNPTRHSDALCCVSVWTCLIDYHNYA